jgi:HxlR-like helix-turn-helix
MSPSLLSKRLKTLERVGVIEWRRGAGQVVEYHVTPAGEELWPIIESMGNWGQRWARGDVKARHMDAGLLMWDIHRNVRVEKLPAPRVVVHFYVRGSIDKKSRFWLVIERDGVDMCLADPGYDVDVYVEGHVRTMVDYWMGRIDFVDAVRSGDSRVDGPRHLVRDLPTWFNRSHFAAVEVP